MTLSPWTRFLSFALRLLSPLAPREFRSRWKREWEGEASHWPGPSLVLAAGRDALHLRFSRSLAAPGAHDSQPKNTAMVSSFFTDLRFSLRTLRSAPWFSLVTVLTLALGIGSSVAMFGVLNSVFLRPLPFPEPDQLVIGRSTFEGELNPWVAGADYYDYRDESEAFQELAAALPFPGDMTVTGGGEAERIINSVASPNLFRALGVRPAAGRFFLDEEGLEGAQAVTILSYSFWQRRLGGDPDVMGTPLTLDGVPYTIVGVLPQDFFFLNPVDLWFPMRPDEFLAAERDMHNWYLVGRLAPDVSRIQAQAGVDVISARLQEAYPESNANKALLLTGLHEVLTEDYRQSLWILTGAVILVLLIACGNGAGILLARAPTRRFELSVRSAMGAPQARLVRLLLAESLGLALAGGVLGTVLAVWFQGLMLEYLRMDLLGISGADISLPVLGVALGLSLLSGLLAGVYPSFRSASGDLTDGLKTGHRSGGDGGSGFRSGLVVAQVALSVVLLAGSGLLVRSLTNLQNLDPGFESGNILTAQIQIPGGRYPDAASRITLVTSIRNELRTIPGVESVGLTTHIPLVDQGNTWRAFHLGREEEGVRVFLRPILPGYLETLEIPVLSGRDFEDEDQRESGYVAVLSQTAADRIFPDGGPVGQTFHLGLFDGTREMEVVGVVGDVRLSRLEDEAEAALYVPYPQWALSSMSIALKTRVASASVAGALKETLGAIDSEIPVARVATLESLVSASMAERRVITLSLALLAFLPLVLASVGLFAVLAYHVSRRKHELGVRIALGADVATVGGMILRQGLALVGVGVVLGVGGALVGTRVLQSLLFGVGSTDPLTLIGVAGLVLGVAFLACAIPVWRAVRSDPRVVLQSE
jgi:putative ABC transport system permease protein